MSSAPKKSSNKKITAFNFSNVFGGQERYLKSLLSELETRGITCDYHGSPDALLHTNSIGIDRNDHEFNIELLNGNRALYMRGWRRTDAAVRVYVQHSNILDGQNSIIKLWIRKLLLRILLIRIDVVIRVCQQSLPESYAPGKVQTIYNGVTLPDLSNEAFEPRPFTLLMVGAINDNKNQLLALQLIERLSEVKLILVGDGPRKAEWKQWAETRGLNSRVRWTGFVDNPEHFYPQADTLLMLSRFEAFPYAVLEAMSYGIPVIATPVGGVPEAITHEKDGLLLPSSELPALCEAVQRLKDKPQWRHQLGLQARQTISERFTLDKMVDDLLNVIEAAARNKRIAK